MERLRDGLRQTMMLGTAKFTDEVTDPIVCFYPPNDDPEKTLEWLVEKDLIRITTTAMESND